MGVDINTYRCRVGQFVPYHGAGGMCIGLNWSLLVNVIGVVFFIRILLIMAGVEQNPGPKEMFVFRYQYLLIEVGTEVLRKVFNSAVNNDFMRHLNAKPKQYLKQLQYLINKDIISVKQKDFLPPIDTNPSSSNFDISLLALLLRNVCGLSPRGDLVWTNPAPGDISIEADIARLRICRNNLQHQGTVLVSEVDFKAKWSELCQILHRLNSVAGLSHLQSDIDNVEHISLDEKLEEKHQNTIKAWTESDRLFEQRLNELESDVDTVKQDLVGVKTDVTNVKQDLVDVTSDVTNVKQDLVDVTSDVSTVKQDLVDVTSDVTNVKQDLVGVMSDVTTVKQELVGVTSDVTNVKQDLVDVTSDVTNVKQDLVDVTSDVSTVKQDLVDVTSDVTNVKQDLVGVTSDVTNVKQDLVGVTSDVTNVKQDLVGVKSDFTSVRKDLADVTSDVSTVQRDVTGVKRKLHEVEQKQKKSKQDVDFSDVQTDLIEFYKRRCSTIPVSPLFDNKDENIQNIYRSPTMCSVRGGDEINCYEKLFCKDSKPYSQIYITGDAGMGKTSFCTFMCSLWSMGKLGDELGDKHKELQKDVEYVSKFDIVFYISLRDTECYDVIDMIGEQYLRHHDPLMIRAILREQRCLILMDGLDEWQPRQDGKKKYTLPEQFYTDNCVYITTSRPYRLESVRLSSRDVDHYVQTTGIQGDASKSYVTDVIQYMNKGNSTNRDVSVFMADIDECGLGDQLCSPMVASHLVVLWFEKTLTNMPRAFIYANILEMLFRRAKKREVEFPPPTASTWQLPGSLHGLEFLKEYVSLLYNVCHLSFRSLFKQDDHVTGLVFTRQQLLSAPYCFSIEETDFMCAIGILSKNEVFGCYSEEKLKVSFIHKSYVEFFASLFTSSFDRGNVFSDATKSWKTLDDILQFENFFLLLAGLSYNKVKSSMENVYLRVSDDLATSRKHYGGPFGSDFTNQTEHLQKIVINCCKEISRSNLNLNIVLRLEDFYFDDSPNDEVLKQLLLCNRTCIKSICAGKGKYLDEFNQINNLKCLKVDIHSPDVEYDEKFNELMVQNGSTLRIVSIDTFRTLIPELPLRNLHFLTSLYLRYVKMQHSSLQNLMSFMSNNFLFENIKLFDISCNDHPYNLPLFYKNSDWYVSSDDSDDDSDEIRDPELDKDFDCALTLNLSNHTKLTTLCLSDVSSLCHYVNKSSLKYIYVCPLSKRIASCYVDLFNCIKDSQVEHLTVDGAYKLDKDTNLTLVDVIKTLPCIKFLTLWHMNFDYDVFLGISAEVNQDTLKIELEDVTMSSSCFCCFMDSIVNKKTVTAVTLTLCKIDMCTNYEDMMELVPHYLTPYNDKVSIIENDGLIVCFETKGC